MPGDTIGLDRAAEVIRAIQEGGIITPDQWRLVVENPDLAAALRNQILGYEASAYFPSPREQFANVRAWAGQRIFAFGPSYVQHVYDMIPQLPTPTLRPLQATFLVPWFGEYASTVELLWRAVREVHPQALSEYGSDLQLIELFDDKPDRPDSPSLQWVQIHLDTNIGLPLLRTPGTGLDTGLRHDPLAGVQLLAAAAHAPAWALQLGHRFPRVTLGQCRWRTSDGWYTVPRMSCATGASLHLLRTTTLVGAGEVAQPTIKVLGP